MATLEIMGRRVEVDDSFRSLSPEQQQATVNEIAQSLGGQTPQEAMRDNPTQLSGRVEPRGNKPVVNRPIDRAGEFAQSVVEGIPIAGPLIQRGTDFAYTNVAGALQGRDPSELQREIDQYRQASDETNWGARLAGNLTGGVGAMGMGAATQVGQQALGLTGNLASRVLNSGATNAMLAGGDALARGERPGDIGDDMLIGGGVGALIPGVGAGINAVARGVGNAVAPLVRGGRNAEQEAARRVASARFQDRAAQGPQMLSQADEMAAQRNGQPILNIDRGGENTRQLARSAANANPDAWATLQKTADDRFVTQNARGQQLVRRIAGGDPDAVLARAQIGEQARQSANPAYRALFNKPENQSVMNAELLDLLRSPTMQKMVNRTTAYGQDLVAGSGQTVPRSPFVFGQNGSVSLRRGVTPSLEFWNYTKRLLDAEINKAKRAGDATNLIQLRQRLLGILDSEVPEYAAVRSARHQLFQAEDAIGAGENFARGGINVSASDARQALGRMTADERKAFEVGYLSRLMDRVRNTNDRTNLTRQFKTPAFREQLELVVGPGRAREFESFVRVEDILDQARGMLGNSTTARQLAAMGLVGGAGGFLTSGGDLSAAGTGSLLFMAGRMGGQALGRKIDENVLRKVAELLASGDDAAINRAMANAALSAQHMAALEAIQQGIGVASRGALQSVALN